jgi:aminoglycoside phosphotransferase (APT) family kinase protein
MRMARVAWAMPELLADVSSSLHAAPVEPVRAALDHAGSVAAIELDEVLGWLEQGAAEAQRDDLVRATGALRTGKPELAPSVVCHGDLHPMNVMTDGTRWSLIDWTACALTDPAYDVAFTAMLLRHPPLASPASLSPAVALAGRVLAAKFIRSYNRRAATPVTEERLRWFEAVHAFRIVLELHWLRKAGPGGVPQHHPWLTMEPHARRALFDHPAVVGTKLAHHL